MNLSRMMTLVIVLMFLSGCAGNKVALTQTGFLSNYSQLKEDQVHKGLQLFRNEDVDIEKYSKVMIAPVEVILDASIDPAKFSSEDKQRLSDFLFKQLSKKLAEDYEVVDEAGPGVMLLRAAITGILPNKVYLNLHWSTTLAGAGIGGASIEAEVVDSLTKEEIISFIDAKKGKRLKYTKGLSKWGHTEEVLEMWSKVLVDNLKVLRGEMIWEKKEREEVQYKI